MPDFVKIDRSEVPDRKGSIAGPGPRTQALLDGETVWVAGESQNAVLGSHAALKARGYRLCTRRMDRDGVRGWAAWAERIQNGADPADGSPDPVASR